MEDVKVMVRFTVSTAFGVFTDALYFTEDEYKVIDRATLDKMEQDRVDAWIDTVAPPLKDLKEKEATLLQQIKDLQATIVNVNQTLAEVQKIIKIREGLSGN